MRIFIRFGPAILVLLGLCIITGGVSICQTMFHYNTEHNGFSGSPDLNTFEHVQWQFKTGGMVFSSLIMADGILYCGSDDSYLYAVDPSTGEQMHRKQGLFGWTSSNMMMDDFFDFMLYLPVVDDSVVYFGSGDSCIYALWRSNGQKKWDYTTGLLSSIILQKLKRLG